MSNRGPQGTVRARRLEPDSPVSRGRFEVLGGSGSPSVEIDETMAAFSAASPPTSPLEASANHAAMVTKLADDEWLERICSEGYSTVVDCRMSFKLSVDAVSRMLLRGIAHVGLERDRLAMWDARTHAEYPTIEVLFQYSDADEKVTAQIKLCTMSLIVACCS